MCIVDLRSRASWTGQMAGSGMASRGDCVVDGLWMDGIVIQICMRKSNMNLSVTPSEISISGPLGRVLR